MSTKRHSRATGNRIQLAANGPRAVRIAIIGFGTVGTGTAKVLLEHQHEVERRLGCRIELKTICDVQKKNLSWLPRTVRITSNWKKVIADPEIDIIVELIGGVTHAREVAAATLRARKHLVTANKQLVAEHGAELTELAGKMGVHLGIEACVMGGTPLLHAVREGLAGEHFTAVYGILNGTTNYILTEMERRNCSFQDALAEAQAKGYAERDPTFDIEGYDARHKITILAMLCFGMAVRVKNVPAEGITRIDRVDFAYAHGLNHTIRLIAGARRRDEGRLEVFVRPMMIARSSPLAHVEGSINGVLLVGSKGGNTTMTGRGAGGEPTGVAVLSDVVGIARSMLEGGTSSSPLGYTHWHPARISPAGEHEIMAYLRLVVRDRPGILAKVCSILARHHINIDSVLQQPAMPKKHLPFVMRLEPTKEKNVARAVKEIARLGFNAAPPVMMPFAELS
jgi:homoserine dehydrogenase